MATTAVATQERQQVTVALLPKMIQSSSDARQFIAPFLPPGVDLDRVAASLKVALAKARADHKGQGEPALFQCDPMSVFMAVAKIAQWGLEVGETAHLVPFGPSCVPVADYKGLAELVITSGVARHVEAHCVYEKEAFRLRRGSNGTELEHEPLTDGKARGAMVGAYAMYFLRGGVTMVEYMTVEDIEAVRQKYSKQWKGGALPEWYARKTVVRRGVKLLPKNARLAERLAALDVEDIEVPEALRQIPVGDEEPARVHRLSVPRPLAQAEDGAYGLTPVAPGSVNDHAEADRGPQHQDEDFQDDRDHVDGELPLGPERTAPAPRRTAQREGR